MGFVGNYAPRGLAPQIDDMPVIPKKPPKAQSEPGFGGFPCKSCGTVLPYLDARMALMLSFKRGAVWKRSPTMP